MILDVYFSGVKLTDYCIIRHIYPRVMPQDETIKLEIGITIKEDVRYNLDQLNRILFTEDEKELTISDDMNRSLLCKLVGGINLSSRFRGAEATLTFESSEKYWYDNRGEKRFDLSAFGDFEVINEGTAPTYPVFEFTFPDENGFVSVVAPNGIITLGNIEEKDREPLPSMESAMKEEMDKAAMSDQGSKDWQLMTSNNRPNGTPWFADYNKLNIGGLSASFDQYGTRLDGNLTSSAKSDYWNVWGYKRDLDKGEVEVGAQNVRLESRITFYDASGSTSRTGMYLITMLDELDRPIMTMSMYNVQSGTNAVKVSAKVNDFSSSGLGYRSRIIYENTFPSGFDGLIRMEKEGANMRWLWNSNKRDQVARTQVTEATESISIGDTVYILNRAGVAYDHDGRQYNIAPYTRGRAHRAAQVRTRNGRREIMITYQGTPVYWIQDAMLTKNSSGNRSMISRTVGGGDRMHTINASLGLIRNTKIKSVVVNGGFWGRGQPFTNASLNSVYVWRMYGSGAFYNVKNLFQPRDTLVINNNTGEVLHNGVPFQGLIDLDSKFFDLDYGKSDIRVITSPWARMPTGRMYLRERYR